MELTEERLAAIEKHALLFADDPLWEDIVAPLLAEVRRLREVENEREEARGLAREYLHKLRTLAHRHFGRKDAQFHPWLLEPEPATATGVAETVFGMTQIAEKPSLQGEIKVGDWFIWEPGLSSARELIEVTQIAVNTDGETWIESENKRGERYWNDEQRFREACARTGADLYGGV